jgi:uncharacterized membrane protein YkvA (DUF1232 family)
MGGMSDKLPSYDPDKLRRDEATVERGFWDKLRRYARRIPFLDEVVAGYYCAKDPATPMHVKAVLFGALAYLVLPFDAVPDLFAMIGFTDDAAVIYAAVRTVRRHISEQHRAAARGALDRLLAERRSA